MSSFCPHNVTAADVLTTHGNFGGASMDGNLRRASHACIFVEGIHNGCKALVFFVHLAYWANRGINGGV